MLQSFEVLPPKKTVMGCQWLWAIYSLSTFVQEKTRRQLMLVTSCIFLISCKDLPSISYFTWNWNFKPISWPLWRRTQWGSWFWYSCLLAVLLEFKIYDISAFKLAKPKRSDSSLATFVTSKTACQAVVRSAEDAFPLSLLEPISSHITKLCWFSQVQKLVNTNI